MDLASHVLMITIYNIFSRINSKLTIRIYEIKNHELTNKKKCKPTLQELNAQNSCKLPSQKKKVSNV